MSNGDTHAGNRPALFSLPEAAPSMVLRVGGLLKASGNPLEAIAIYEHFITNLQQHSLAPIDTCSGGEELLRSLPVRSNPKQYSLA